jgi:hypothetical protein
MKLLEVIKNKALLIIAAIKTALAKIAASDKAVSEAEHDRVMADKLQGELNWFKQEYEQQLQDLEEYLTRLREVAESLRKTAGILLKSGVPYETIYTLVAGELDRGGWRRFGIAKRLIPENIYTFFYAEDCLGQFEEMEGNELLYWLELTKYGVLNHFTKGCYEIVGSHRLRTEDKDYTDYRKRLHRLVLDELIAEKKDSPAASEYPAS